MSRLRNHDIQEHDGRRLVVFSRQYQGTVWQVHHSLPDDYFFAQAFNDDYENIVPKRIIKLTDSICQFEFHVPVSGWASVFHLTPLLKRRRISFNSVTSMTFNHKYGNTDYLHQFWCETPEGYVLFEPKDIDKTDPQVAKVEFQLPATGYVDFGRSFPRERMVQIKDKIWEYRHMSTEAERQHIFVQCTGSDEKVFYPDRISRLDEVKSYQTDNILELEHDDPLTGSINTVIHGHRI